jgi:prepilin-type N-terminal cleavage/methylation domain-containing protein
MKKSKGFTLVELMVVIVIIGILAALAIPKLLGATSKAKLSEFKPVLKSIYTLQETHFNEAGAYTTDSAAIGYTTPGGKANFKYGILVPTTAGLLGTASSKSGVSIKLSDGSYIGGTTGTPEAVACVDTAGIQFGAKQQIAQDAGLSAAGGTSYFVSTACTVVP